MRIQAESLSGPILVLEPMQKEIGEAKTTPILELKKGMAGGRKFWENDEVKVKVWKWGGKVRIKTTISLHLYRPGPKLARGFSFFAYNPYEMKLRSFGKLTCASAIQKCPSR